MESKKEKKLKLLLKKIGIKLNIYLRMMFLKKKEIDI